MFELRLLASFVAVAEKKHFAQAAETLNATQPGVSQQIARLEHQLGFKLFERTKRSVALTAAGEAFLLHTRKLFRTVERMQEEGLQISRGFLGTLAVGMQSSTLYSNIPSKIIGFKKSFPNIVLKFEVLPGEFLVGRMGSEELDVAITSLPISSAGYASGVIGRQEMGVAVPQDSPLAAREAVALSDLVQERFIVVPRSYDPRGHDTLISKMLRLGAEIQVVGYETPSLSVLARVAVGEGVALIPYGYRRENHDAVRIIRLVDEDLGTTDLYLAVRKDNVKATTKRFLEVMFGGSVPDSITAEARQVRPHRHVSRP